MKIIKDTLKGKLILIILNLEKFLSNKWKQKLTKSKKNSNLLNQIIQK